MLLLVRHIYVTRMDEKYSESDLQSPSSVVEDDPQTVLSHGDALAQFQRGIADLISSDTALSYLPRDVSLEEARLQLALHEDKAVTVFLRKLDDSIVPIPVMQGSRVLDLKRSVRLHVGAQLRRSGKTMPISWKYVWKTYNLAIGQTKLDDNNKFLLDYGIGNRSEVTFIKKLRRENKGKRSRPRPEN